MKVQEQYSDNEYQDFPSHWHRGTATMFAKGTSEESSDSNVRRIRTLPKALYASPSANSKKTLQGFSDEKTDCGVK